MPTTTVRESRALDLKAKFEKLERESRDITEGLRDGKTSATPATKSRLQACISEMEELERQITALYAEQDAEELAALTEQLHEGRDRVANGGAGLGISSRIVSEHRPSSLRYSSMFSGPEVRNSCGFKSVGEFLRAVAFEKNDSRLVPAHSMRAQGMGEMIDSDGGFAVPPMFISKLLDVNFESEVVRGADPGPEVFPMAQGQKISVPGIDGADHSSALLGGISVEHLAEGATGTVQKPKLRLVTLEPKKLAIFASATNELLADAPQFENQILRKFGEAISFVLDEDFLSGDGAGKAQGATHVTNPALVVVAKEGAQAGGTIVYANLTKMLARLHPSLWRGARWVIHPSTLPQLLTLSLPVGTGGSHIPVLREDGSGTLRMLGLPVFVSEKLQPLGSQGDILLVNFRGYGVAFRQGMQILRSVHAGFMTDETVFRLTLRADGQSLWNAPITPRNGTDTLSWSIVLAERA